MARVAVDIAGIAEVKLALESLPDELLRAGGTSIRAGMRAAGQVVLAAMVANVDAIVAAPNKDGRMVSTGLLRQSLRVRRRPMLAGKKGETYLVGPVNARYPNGERVQAVGAMLEYGTAKRPPMPWAEPAYQATRAQALQVMVDTVRARLARIIARYERQRARGGGGAG
jgi:hypothetical protein